MKIHRDGMSNNIEMMSKNNIQNRIFTIRSLQVILELDLAKF